MTDISGSNTVSDGSTRHYTPTTEEVRHGWKWRDDDEFDRWLAEVKAEAWEEGHQQPWELGVGGYALKAVNPYRQGETE